jgi:hypothetical protein
MLVRELREQVGDMLVNNHPKGLVAIGMRIPSDSWIA